MSKWPGWDVLLGCAEAPISAPVLRLQRTSVLFEWFRPEPAIILSQSLAELKVRHNGRVVYEGSATVTDLADLGTTQACEVRLADPGLRLAAAGEADVPFLPDGFDGFLQDWQANHYLPDDFKLACLNLYTFLSDLKAALAGQEVVLAQQPEAERAAAEITLLEAWAPGTVAGINQYHEAFELAAARLEASSRETAEALVRRLLSPMFLVAPFGHRTFYKPLGYAGDFEMMGMIMRNTFEGETLFAKLMHHWLVQQWAALSVRNRIRHLEQRLHQESAGALGQRRAFRVLNIGCGPAWEVQNFIRGSSVANSAEFTLVDFDATAAKYVTRKTAEAVAAAGRRAKIQVVQMSVNQLIKESLRSQSAPLGRDFDFIYCVGLFDYLPVRMCQQLTQMFYDWVAPGGLVAVANMKDEKPYRHMVEHLLDWHLSYRSAKDMEKFVPAGCLPDDWEVVGEELAINLFLELRKPKGAGS